MSELRPGGKHLNLKPAFYTWYQGSKQTFREFKPGIDYKLQKYGSKQLLQPGPNLVRHCVSMW